MGEISWGMVATVNEPAPLVLAWVAHHLSLGAHEIHIYLDDPKDPVGPQLDGINNVFVTRCDNDYWRSIAPYRPPYHNRRQHRNATHAQAKCGVTFLMSCDADEFLRPGSEMQEQLAEIPDNYTWCKIFNLERALITDAPRDTIFDGVFKAIYHHVDTTALRQTPMAPMGFTWHYAGKPMVRTSAGLNIGIHTPRRGHIKKRRIPPNFRADLVQFVHFDGLTPLHWATKFIRQAANTPERLDELPPFRITQWRRIFKCMDDPAALNALFEEINGYTKAEAAALALDGHIVRDRFDLAPALAETFPGMDVDLSPEAFDAILAPRVARWQKKARKSGVL